MGNLCCAREHSVQFFAQFFTQLNAQFNCGPLNSLWHLRRRRSKATAFGLRQLSAEPRSISKRIPSGISGRNRVDGKGPPSNTLTFPSQISFHTYYILIPLSSWNKAMIPLSGRNVTSVHKKIKIVSIDGFDASRGHERKISLFISFYKYHLQGNLLWKKKCHVH
jgi:hypothetical protein